MIRVIVEPQRPRLRARRVTIDLVTLLVKVRETNTWQYVHAHGGEVANTYGYVVETETVVAVANPTGDVAAWFGRAPANKVTGRSVAINSLPFHRQCGQPEDWWDLRCGEVRRRRARHALKALWYEAFPEETHRTSCLWCISRWTL